jgi:predicted MFS family arabinose efflux permease
VAIALGAAGTGSMLVALLLPRLLDKRPDRPVMLGGTILMAAGLAWMGTGPDLLALLMAWFLVGAGWSAVQTPAGRLVNRSASPGDRPAYFSAQFALSHACWLVLYSVAGQLGTRIGIETTALVLSATVVVFAVVAAALWPARDDEPLPHVHDELDHEHEHVHDEHHDHEHGGWEGDEPHRHPHRHGRVKHSHIFVIDDHHHAWPRFRVADQRHAHSHD